MINWRDLSDIHIFNMAAIFLFLLFPGMGMGNLLRVRMPGQMGQQRFYERTVSANLWFRGNCRPDFYVAFPNRRRTCIHRRYGKCHVAGIFYGSCDGKDVSCTVLGLQWETFES